MCNSRMILNTIATVLVMLATTVTVNATPISLQSATVIEYAPGNLVTANDVQYASDGDNGTAFFVQTARNPATPTQGLGGFEVRWDFDVSGYTTIDQFTFNFLGSLYDPSSFDAIGIGYALSNANTSTYTKLVMPDGVPVAVVVDLVNGALLPKNELSYYVTGGVLSVFTSTLFGFSSYPSISMEVFEVSADIVGTSATVPGPATVLVVLFGLVLIRVRSARS